MEINWESQVLSSVSKVIPKLSCLEIDIDKLHEVAAELSEDSFSYNSVTLDLHGYTLRDANIAIKDLINNSYNKGIKKMTIITGKGMRSKNYDDPFKSKKLSILTDLGKRWKMKDKCK